MESVNFIKDPYPKPSPSPATSINNNKNRRKILVISIAAVCLTIIIGSLLLLTAVIHNSVKPDSPTIASSNSNESLRTVCSVTRYPESCFSSISPLINTVHINDPLRFFNLSLHVSIIEVSTLKNLSGSNNEPAVKDCVELFDDSASQLTQSAKLMSVGVGKGKKGLTETSISDMKTWISAAMTDQETCIDGLEEMGSTAVDQFKIRVHRAQEYMSNTLAILNNIHILSKKLLGRK